MRTSLALLLAVVAVVASQSSCGPVTCDPANTGDCSSGTSCDPVTKACVTPASCTTDDSCTGGFACSASSPKTCFVNCAALGSGTDLFCKSGFKCGSTYSCDVITNCTPDGTSSFCNGGQCDANTKNCVPVKKCTTDSECGNYGCSLSECYLSCARDTQCASGKTCNVASGKCQ